jgi:hypothetical protein
LNINKFKKKKHKIKIKNGVRHWWLMSVILATQEEGIRRIMIFVHAGTNKKLIRPHINQKLRALMCTCHVSYTSG